MTVVVGSLCTGVAGLDLGVHAAYGGDTRLAWYAEINPDASQILSRRLPGVPNLGDLTAVDWTRVARVDLLCAGFPCQPVSGAGKRLGEDDRRWLWDDVRACYRALRPQELMFENVRNLVSIDKGRLFAKICQDLRDDGYAVRWALAGACAVGAPHHRHRVFVVARYAWQLHAPAPERVPMIECGARRGKSRALLPTPTASRYGRNQGGQNPGGPVRWSLDQAHLLLPTPGAYDGDRGGPQSPDKRKAGNHAVCLQDAVHGLLPTPVVSDAARGPNPPAWPAGNLTTAVDRLLPTPVVSDGVGGAGHCPTSTGGENLRTAVTLLPTPRARDVHGGDYDAARQAVRAARSGMGGLSLPDVAQQQLLPPPAMLPTATVADSRNSRNATSRDPANPRGGWARETLCDVTHDRPALLPTPRHSDADKGSPNQHGSRPGDPMLPSAVIGERYGRYAQAVTLWEELCGVPAPAPTIRNSKGQWRLNPELPEWMMGYPPGWITALVGRSAALRGAGNGVVPHVVAAVYPLLTQGWPYLRGGDLCPDPIVLDPPSKARAGRPAARRRAAPAKSGSCGSDRPQQLTLC